MKQRVADVAKRVDARDLKSLAARHAGSTPAVRTTPCLKRPPTVVWPVDLFLPVPA